MNFLSSLLPGFRDLRAPLIAGYLWLFFCWLLLRAGDALPTKNDGELYKDLFDLGHAIRPVGLAIVASVVAYVLGSLASQLLRWAWQAPDNFRGRSSLVARRPDAGSRSGSGRRHVTLASVLRGYEPTVAGTLDQAVRIQRRLTELAHNETDEAAQRLREACHLAESQVTQARSSDASAIALPVTDDDEIILPSDSEATYAIPRISAARDIFGERKVIIARLMDTSPLAGSTIDKLQAESEFRFAIAWPLLAVIIALSATANQIWWLVLIPVPVLLAVHGIGLHRDANLELVDALRTRTGAALRQLTPAYARYRDEANTLAEAIETTDWAGWSEGLQPEPAAPSS